jgi:hypothetical protein
VGDVYQRGDNVANSPPPLPPPSLPGFFVPRFDQPWGLLPVSWTNAMNIWQKPDPYQSSCEEAMLEGCRIIKAVNPATRCFRSGETGNFAVLANHDASYFLQLQQHGVGTRVSRLQPGRDGRSAR